MDKTKKFISRKRNKQQRRRLRGDSRKSRRSFKVTANRTHSKNKNWKNPNKEEKYFKT